MPDYKNTLQVKADDPCIKSEYINYDSPNGWLLDVCEISFYKK